MTISNIHTAPVNACAFGGQEHLLTADLDGKILHWRVGAEGRLTWAATLRPADGQPIADLICSDDAVWALQGTRLLGWRLADGGPLPPVTLPALAHLLAHRAGSKGAHLVVAGETAWTYLQWGEDGWQVQAHEALPEGVIDSVDVAPDGRHILAVVDGEGVLVLETASGANIDRFYFRQDATGPGRQQVRFAPEALYVYISQRGSYDVRRARWNSGLGKTTLMARTTWALPLVSSPDGRALAARIDGHAVRVWRTATSVVTQQPACSRILLHQARVRAIGQRGSDVRVMLMNGRVWRLDADTGAAMETSFRARLGRRTLKYWHQHSQLFWQGERYFLAEAARLLAFDAEGAVTRETPIPGKGRAIAWLPGDRLWTYDEHQDALFHLALPEGEFETREPIAPDAGTLFPFAGSSFTIAWAGGPYLILKLTRRVFNSGEYYLYDTKTRQLTLLPDVYWPESSVDGRYFGLARFPGQWAIHDVQHIDAGPLLTWKDVEGGHLWRVTQIVPRLEAGRVFGVDGNHNRVIVWDTEGHILAELHGHPHAIRGLVPAADGRGCLVWDQEGTFRYWTI